MTGDLQFRTARPEDAAAIRALVLLAYAKWVPVIGREPRPMTADYDRAVVEHDFDLAQWGARLVGLIETEPRDGHLWIENVAVHPEAQGKGIGRELLTRAERRASACGLAETRLVTNGAFEANIALYQRVGYVITTREPFWGGIAVYMSKQLV